MKIILSTYAFYPYASGGTEVYTLSMAEYLVSHGHQVLIAAGWNGEPAAGEEQVWNDEEIKAGLYLYRGLQVLGIHLKQQTVESVYSNEKQPWLPAYTQIFTQLNWSDAALLVMNGVSAVSGLSLCKALQQMHPAIRLSVIVHTPFVCAKADMLFAGTGRRCQQTITPATCAACVTAAGTGLPFALSKIANSVANSGIFSAVSRSAFFSQHKLLQLKIKGLQWLNAKADRWIVFSNDMKLFLEKQPFIDIDKVRVIRHGIDKANFYPPLVKPPLAPAVFLYAGRFETIKGIDLLCEAWKKLPEDAGLRKLCLAGNWDQTAAGRQVHAALAARRDVEFIPSLPQHELADFYRRVHCVIIPSRWVETGPLVMHEAIACGCDVISSNLGGQAELAALYAGKSHVFNLQQEDSLYRLLLNYQAADSVPVPMPWSAAEHFDAVTEAMAIAG